MKTGYIGFSLYMAQTLVTQPGIELVIWICEKRRWTEDKQALCEEYGVSWRLVQDKTDVNIALQESGADVFIMYQFGVIVSEDAAVRHRIINFHPGSIESNRGRTPVVRSILRGDTYSKMTAFEIGGGVDIGREITSRFVGITEDMGSGDLQKSLEEQIPAMLGEVRCYLETDMIKTRPGLYCPRITEADYTLDLNKDDLYTVKRKVLSQSTYAGALMDGRFIRSIEILDYAWEPIGESKNLVYEVRARVVLNEN